MKDPFNDQVIIITGASAGIGKSLALMLASQCASGGDSLIDQRLALRFVAYIGGNNQYFPTKRMTYLGNFFHG